VGSAGLSTLRGKWDRGVPMRFDTHVNELFRNEFVVSFAQCTTAIADTLINSCSPTDAERSVDRDCNCVTALRGKRRASLNPRETYRLLQKPFDGFQCAQSILRSPHNAMNVTFFDQQDESNPINGSVIADSEELSRLLDNLRSRSPFLAELIGANGYVLMIGIGGPVGCAQHSRSDGSPPYLVAVAPNPIAEDECIDFLIGNTPTPIPVRYILPFEKMKEIASCFQETGARSAAVTWEEV
jgi:hypothetical protein